MSDADDRKNRDEGNKVVAMIAQQGRAVVAEGKAAEKKEAAYLIGVTEDQKVRLEFNSPPLQWLVMTPRQALEMGRMLIKKANDVNNSKLV